MLSVVAELLHTCRLLFIDPIIQIKLNGLTSSSSKPPTDYRWPNGRPGPARPGTGPAKHGPFKPDPLKHENITGPCRACPWAEVPAQAWPEIDLIGPGRPVWPGSPAAQKYLNRV